MDDDFISIVDENLKVERKKTPFKITQLKLTNYYWNSGDIDVGMPVSTSIELSCKYNYEKDKLDWNRKVSHTYLSLKNCYEETTDSYIEELTNADIIIPRLEEIDLRDFKNNYFTDEMPECFTHWEITYNTYFKIVGTYDRELEVFKKISELLDFRKIMKDEVKKIEDKINQQ